MDLTRLLSHSTKKPKSILRIVLSVSIILMVLWLFMVSRMELNNGREAVLVSAGADSTQTTSVRSTLLNEPVQTERKTHTGESEEAANVFQNAFVTFLVMVSILGGIWVWSKRKSSTPIKTGAVSDIDQHVLGQGAQLKIVEINNEIWVLGLTAGTLTLLHRYNKDEWQSASINQQEEYSEEVQKPDFKAIYNLFGN